MSAEPTELSGALSLISSNADEPQIGRTRPVRERVSAEDVANLAAGEAIPGAVHSHTRGTREFLKGTMTEFRASAREGLKERFPELSRPADLPPMPKGYEMPPLPRGL